MVLLFTVAMSAVIALVFGLIPMRAASGIPLALTLKRSAAPSNLDRNRFSGRKLLVALQISMCTVPLFSGELLYQTLRNLESHDLGTRTVGLLVFGIEPQSNIRTDAEAVRLHLRIQQGVARNSRYTSVKELDRQVAYLPLPRCTEFPRCSMKCMCRATPRR